MSQGERTRRRFMADLLFLGGALSVGAFLSQTEAQGPDPAASATPHLAPTPDGGPTVAPPPLGGEPMPPQAKGDVVAPGAQPSCAPAIEGESKPPEIRKPMIQGRSAAPRKE